MNLNMFDDIDGFILRERESAVLREDSERVKQDSDDGMSVMPKNMSLAMAYVPFQQWSSTSSPEKALDSGTLFPDLVFPFEKGGRR